MLFKAKNDLEKLDIERSNLKNGLHPKNIEVEDFKSGDEFTEEERTSEDE